MPRDKEAARILAVRTERLLANNADFLLIQRKPNGSVTFVCDGDWDALVTDARRERARLRAEKAATQPHRETDDD